MKKLRSIAQDSLDLLLAEWKFILSSVKTAVPFFVILFIPVLYAGMFLWAFWDPYGKTERIPVAVVNLDKGATIKGKNIDVGNELVQTLRKDKTLKWTFVDEKEAKKQLKNQKIYMYIEIPSTFSSNAASLLDNKLTPASMKYVPNQGMNYVVSKINDVAAEKIKEKVAKKITKQYADIMFDSFEKLAGGLNSAAEGSQKIGDGLNEVTKGTQVMKENLESKKENIASLSQGAQTIDTGMDTVQKGAASLVSGTKQLKEGVGKTTDGTKALSVGLETMEKSVGQLAAGSTQLSQSTTQLQQLAASFLVKHPELQTDLDYQTIVALAAGVDGGMKKLSPSLVEVHNGTQKMVSSTKALADGQTKVYTSFDALLQGEYHLQTGVNQLKQGTQKVAKGTTDVYSGWNTVIDGVGKLQDGQTKVLDGNQELTAKLTDAYDQVKEVKGTKERTDMFAEPLTLTKKVQNEVPNYGTALSPYFLSMGLFVGILVSSVIYAFRESAGMPKTATGWFVSKTIMVLFISVVQALLLDVVLLDALKLHVDNTAVFIFFTLVAGLTFASIIQFLITAFANVGRFLVILLMIVQLTSSGGTFPIELLPEKLKTVYDALPMTHTIHGFRSIISMNDVKGVASAMNYLGICIGVFALLTYGTFYLFQKKKEA